MDESLDKLLQELLEAQEPDADTPDAHSARARIVQAALVLFAERSYEATTTKAIASRAGVTERTLFKHFPSKEELFARTVFPALLRVMQPLAVDRLKQAISGHPGDFRATVRAIVTERIAFATRHPALVTMFVREVLSRPAFRSALATFFRAQVWPQISEVLTQAIAAGQMRPLPPEVALRTIVGQIGAYLVPRLLLADTQPWDDAAEVDRIVELILHGLAG